MLKLRAVMLFYAGLLWAACSAAGGVLAQPHPQHRTPEQQAEITPVSAVKQAPPLGQSMVVMEGETVVLPCHLPKPPSSLGETRVDWHTKDTSKKKSSDIVFLEGPEPKVEVKEKMVHHFYQGREDLTYQDSAYHNRTRLFTNQLEQGNFSLEIRNVSERENFTTYQCVTFYNGNAMYLSSITLEVQLKKDGPNITKGSPPTDNNGYGRLWYIGKPAAGGLMLVFILTFTAIGVRKKCKSTSHENGIALHNGEERQQAHLMAMETRVELEMRDVGRDQQEQQENGGAEKRGGELVVSSLPQQNGISGAQHTIQP